MFHILLFEPKIPSNTGAIIRLCANCGSQLHLIKPLAFDLSDKKLQRAGLDYHEYASLRTWDSLSECLEVIQPSSISMFTTKGTDGYSTREYQPNAALIFGSETDGLPESVRTAYGQENCLRIPMLNHSRSINLANAVSIVVYEAWRQNHFTSI